MPYEDCSKTDAVPCECGHRQGAHHSFIDGGCVRCLCTDFRYDNPHPDGPPKPECTAACAEGHTYSGSCMLRAYGPLATQEPPLTPEEEEAAPMDSEHEPIPYALTERAAGQADRPRRPPYAVAYAVSGRLFEALVPGDCAVEAVDGALVIRHGEPVNGITTVAPVRKAS